MLGTKEFYDLMDAFEKVAKNEIRTGASGLKREPRENWGKRLYYTDGTANEAFKIFMHGYSFGKLNSKQ